MAKDVNFPEVNNETFYKEFEDFSIALQNTLHYQKTEDNKKEVILFFISTSLEIECCVRRRRMAIY